MCYFEVDSLIPLNHPDFEFLRKRPEDTAARIKTIKLKGKFSQGLILPLDTIKPVYLANNGNTGIFNAIEGNDLTAALGVTKYEAPIPTELAGITMGPFPSFVSKTDETRIQAAPNVLERHRGKVMYVTEKLDGSSITVFLVPKNHPGLPRKYVEESTDDRLIFGVASRNMCIKESADNAYWRAVRSLDIENKLRDYGVPIILQGELIGPGVQGNKLKRDKLEIRWFNVIAPVSREIYNFGSAQFTLRALGLESVPVLYSKFDLDHTVDDLVALSRAKSILNPDVWREGIVVRPRHPCEDEELGNLSFKVINPEFLVKYDE